MFSKFSSIRYSVLDFDVLFDEVYLCEIIVFEIFKYSVFGPWFHWFRYSDFDEVYLCEIIIFEIFEYSVLDFIDFDVLFDEMCLCEIIVFEIFEYSVFGPRFHWFRCLLRRDVSMWNYSIRNFRVFGIGSSVSLISIISSTIYTYMKL